MPRHATALETAGPASALVSLRRALDGSGPALAPIPTGTSGSAVRQAATLDEPVPDDVALLLPTSGSTGAPKVVELTAAALRHSADATHHRLGGPGRWLLALPLTHVAGWQVLVRSVVAGLDPTVLDLAHGFDVRAFTDLAAATDGPRRYTSLVPTQLVRLLDDGPASAALRAFDAVLVGGAAAPASLLDRATAAGVRVVTTYGTTETSGGCVYDGQPLDGVKVRLDDEGRVLVSGPVLARGYRELPRETAEAFTLEEGARWFATSDAGRLGLDGSLTLLGRLDDVVVTGGANVSPASVEAALTGRAGVAECIVVGVPDEHWGQAVTALVVPGDGQTPTTDGVRAALRGLLPADALPRHVVVVRALPLRGPGKPDRSAAADLARRALATGG